MSEYIDNVHINAGSLGKKSIYSLDIAKFCLAVIVVQIHSSGYTIPFSGFAVPLFFTISGFLFFTKYDKKQNALEKFSYLMHFEKRLLLLYLFWFVIQLPYIYIVRKIFFENILHGDFRILFLLLFHSTFIASWFLAALFVGMIVVCGLSSIMNKCIVFILSYLLYCLIVISGVLPSQIHEIFVYLYAHFYILAGRSFMYALVFIALGAIIAEYRGKMRFPNKILFILLMVCLLSEISVLFVKNSLIHYFFIMFIPVLFCCTATELLIRIAPQNLSEKQKGICSFLRKASIILYCSHGGIACLLRFILYNTIGKTSTVIFCLFPLTSTLAFLLALVIVKLSKNRYFFWLKFAY